MGRQRKIGIVTEYFYPHLGGVTEHVYYSAKELIRRGFEVVILTGDPGEKVNVTLPEGLRIIYLGKSYPIFSNDSYAKVTLGWNVGQKIKKVLAEENFDLLHIHSPAVMTLPCLFGKYTNTVTVGTLHTYFDRAIFFELFGKTAQRFLSKLDGLIAVSPSGVTAMKKYFEIEANIIPNGVDTGWFSNSENKIKRFDDGTLNVFFLGRVDPRNGLDFLIQAFPQVVQQRPNTRLIIAGDGKLKPLYEKMSGELLNKNIFFVGAINQERPDYFATSDVFCYPATKASFGITLLEAMSAGVPVIAADNVGFRDLITHEKTGLLVSNIESPQNLAQAIVRVLNDQALSSSLKHHGLKMADTYSWSHVMDRVLDYYNEVYLKVRGELFAS